MSSRRSLNDQRFYEKAIVNPSTFEYYSTVENNKISVLLKVPNLKKVPQEKRVYLTNIAEKLLDRQAGLAGKERYIGVLGMLNTMMIKTPSKEDNAIYPFMEFL